MQPIMDTIAADLAWMAWTPPTAIFFAALALIWWVIPFRRLSLEGGLGSR